MLPNSTKLYMDPQGLILNMLTRIKNTPIDAPMVTLYSRVLKALAR